MDAKVEPEATTAPVSSALAQVVNKEKKKKKKRKKKLSGKKKRFVRKTNCFSCSL